MSRLTHAQAKAILLEDRQLLDDYNDLKYEYDFLVQLYQARTGNKLTQKQLAVLSGIDQANISKIESGEYSPSLKTMKRLADSLNMDLRIELVPRNE